MATFRDGDFDCDGAGDGAGRQAGPPRSDLAELTNGRRRLALWVVGGAVAGVAIAASGALDSPVPSAAAAGGFEAVASPSTAIATAPEQRLPTGPGGPLLTPADWTALAGSEVVIRDDLPRPAPGSPRELPVDASVCGVDVALLGLIAPVQVEAARYLMPFYRDGGRVNEFVLRFADDDAADAALRELRRQYSACPALSASSNLGVYADRPPRGFGALFDDLFAAEATRADSELGPVQYSLLAARRANAVVVVESADGWSERGMRTLLFAVLRAG